MTINTPTPAPTFGQRIEAALVAAWSDAKQDGAALLASAEAFGARELGVVENAIIQTWNVYEPKAVALLQTYVETAVSELGSGASLEQVAESVVGQDAEQGAASFLEGAVSAGLKAIVAALIASL
jgi:N-acyl-D-aspartate/D-glutamate deacylase